MPAVGAADLCAELVESAVDVDRKCAVLTRSYRRERERGRLSGKDLEECAMQYTAAVRALQQSYTAQRTDAVRRYNDAGLLTTREIADLESITPQTALNRYGSRRPAGRPPRTTTSS